MTEQTLTKEEAAALEFAKDVMKRADDAFTNGEITKTNEILSQLPEKKVPASLQAKYYFLFLGVGLYGQGDPEAIRRVNQRINFSFQPSMRYRLALRTGDLATAKKIRSQDNLPFDVTEDFGWSASLSCIWSGKRRMGLALYHKRMHARNFGNFIPEGAVYDPYHGGKECGHVFLEQGVGDWMMHLAVMRRITKREDHAFIGEARAEPFVKQYFPKATFRRAGQTYEDLKDRVMHGSGDYLAAAYLADGAFQPVPMAKNRVAGANPVIGVCWRGGSAQNRREERRIPLHMFLDMLPKGYSYVALQADITEEEKDILRKDGRVILPNFDIRRHTYGLFQAVQRMAGVIAVDSANWHLAGLARVPIYALMNKTIHWYWGPDADVASVYPDAIVKHKSDVNTKELQDWCASVTDLHKSVRPAKIKSSTKASNLARPVFIVGVPRSGTSMVTGALEKCGLWMGQTIAGNKDNEKGFFENRDIRENIVKPALANLGVDPVGVTSLIPINQLATDPILANRMLHYISEQGYNQKSRWGFKEPKLTLLWPMWVDAFPNASWVILERDREAVVKSCQNTGFMARHSKDAEYWRHFINRYDDRLQTLENTVEDVTRIKTDQLAQGDLKALKALVDHLGLTWDEKAVSSFLDPSLFGRH